VCWLLAVLTLFRPRLRYYRRKGWRERKVKRRGGDGFEKAKKNWGNSGEGKKRLD
jgi:hypothetical protein